MTGNEYWIQPGIVKLSPTLFSISVICLHHEMYSFKLHPARLLSIAKAGKLSFWTLGEQTRKLVEEEYIQPRTLDGQDGFEWTRVPVEVFVSVST